jgi:hypothetical protein
MIMELHNRVYSANDENDWIRDYAVEYAGGGWFRIEVSDSCGTFGLQTTYKGSRSERDAERMAGALMAEAADNARSNCPCGTDGEDEKDSLGVGNGNFACGSLSPHGIHVHVSEDGNDVTQDYELNEA